MGAELTFAGFLLLGWSAPAVTQTPRPAARLTDSVLVDFTGDRSPEVWKVEATPWRPDSLSVTMSVVRAGRSLYSESWVVAGRSDSVHLRRVLKEVLDPHRLYPPRFDAGEALVRRRCVVRGGATNPRRARRDGHERSGGGDRGAQANS